MPSALAWVIGLVLGVNPYLEEGRALYEAVRYHEAEGRLRVARQVPSSGLAEWAEASDLLARALIAQGRVAEAEAVYEELLVRSPNHPDPERASPKIRAAFLSAKQRLYPEGYVRLEWLAPSAGRLRASMLDPWGKVAELLLVDAAGRGQAPSPTRDETGAILLGPAAIGPGWELWALDRSGGRLASLPLPAPAERKTPERPPPATKRSPSGWTIGLGVSAAAASAAAIALHLSAEADYRAAGEATEAARARALDSRYQQKAVGARALLGTALLTGGLAIVGVVVSF